MVSDSLVACQCYGDAQNYNVPSAPLPLFLNLNYKGLVRGILSLCRIWWTCGLILSSPAIGGRVEGRQICQYHPLLACLRPNIVSTFIFWLSIIFFWTITVNYPFENLYYIVFHFLGHFVSLFLVSPKIDDITNIFVSSIFVWKYHQTS